MAGIVEGSAERYAMVHSLVARDFAPPARIVELGAAPGDQAASFAAAGYAVTAVDLGEASDAWAGAAEGRMDRLFREVGVQYVEWDLARTPYPLLDDRFDVVLLTEVFEHLRDYPLRTLEEAYRVLRPGGRLYFTTPNAAYVLNRLRALRGRSTATSVHDWMYGLPHARHAREYTFDEVDELFRAANLRIVQRESRHLFMRAGDQSRVALVAKRALDGIARVRPTLGPSIIVVAEKPTG